MSCHACPYAYPSVYVVACMSTMKIVSCMSCVNPKSILPCMSFYAYPILTFMPCMSCHVCPILIVLLCMSCHVCPILTVLTCMSCRPCRQLRSYYVCRVIHVLRQPNNYHVLHVVPCVSSNTIVSCMSWHDAQWYYRGMYVVPCISCTLKLNYKIE